MQFFFWEGHFSGAMWVRGFVMNEPGVYTRLIDQTLWPVNRSMVFMWFLLGGRWRVKLHSLPKEPGSQLWCANEEADFCCSLVDLFIFVHLSQQESPGYHFSTWPCNEPSQKWDAGWLTVGFLGWPLIWQERPSGSNGHICRQSESSASLGQCYRWWKLVVNRLPFVVNLGTHNKI